MKTTTTKATSIYFFASIGGMLALAWFALIGAGLLKLARAGVRS